MTIEIKRSPQKMLHSISKIKLIRRCYRTSKPKNHSLFYPFFDNRNLLNSTCHTTMLICHTKAFTGQRNIILILTDGMIRKMNRRIKRRVIEIEPTIIFKFFTEKPISFYHLRMRRSSKRKSTIPSFIQCNKLMIRKINTGIHSWFWAYRIIFLSGTRNKNYIPNRNVLIFIFRMANHLHLLLKNCLQGIPEQQAKRWVFAQMDRFHHLGNNRQIRNFLSVLRCALY